MLSTKNTKVNMVHVLKELSVKREGNKEAISEQSDKCVRAGTETSQECTGGG